MATMAAAWIKTAPKKIVCNPHTMPKCPPQYVVEEAWRPDFIQASSIDIVENGVWAVTTASPRSSATFSSPPPPYPLSRDGEEDDYSDADASDSDGSSGTTESEGSIGSYSSLRVNIAEDNELVQQQRAAQEAEEAELARKQQQENGDEEEEEEEETLLQDDFYDTNKPLLDHTLIPGGSTLSTAYENSPRSIRSSASEASSVHQVMSRLGVTEEFGESLTQPELLDSVRSLASEQSSPYSLRGVTTTGAQSSEKDASTFLTTAKHISPHTPTRTPRKGYSSDGGSSDSDLAVSFENISLNSDDESDLHSIPSSRATHDGSPPHLPIHHHDPRWLSSKSKNSKTKDKICTEEIIPPKKSAADERPRAEAFILPTDPDSKVPPIRISFAQGGGPFLALPGSEIVMTGHPLAHHLHRLFAPSLSPKPQGLPIDPRAVIKTRAEPLSPQVCLWSPGKPGYLPRFFATSLITDIKNWLAVPDMMSSQVELKSIKFGYRDYGRTFPGQPHKMIKEFTASVGVEATRIRMIDMMIPKGYLDGFSTGKEMLWKVIEIEWDLTAGYGPGLVLAVPSIFVQKVDITFHCSCVEAALHEVSGIGKLCLKHGNHVVLAVKESGNCPAICGSLPDYDVFSRFMRECITGDALMSLEII